MAACLILSFLLSAASFMVVRVTGRAGAPIAALLPLGLFSWFLAAGWSAPPDSVEKLAWVPALGVTLDLRLDGFAWLFALLVTGIGTLVVIYAGAYFAQAPAVRRANFIGLILLFMSAMLGTVLADSLVGLYVFWELTSLLSYLIIGFDSAKPAARKAALQSLIVTAAGGLALFGAILLIGQVLGTWSLSQIAARGPELAASPLAPVILGLVLLGAFTKSAQFPFHFWLPNAMAAPTPASAFLHSATMVKLGVYLLARLDAPFSSMPAFGPLLVLFGGVTMLVALLRALSDGGFKAILAHSTVGSLGLLVLLIGLDGPQATTAMVVFILAHALYKAALFFCAGTAIHATHAADVRDMQGLGRALPLTALACVLAALSMAGLPPFIAFIAKETAFEALLAAPAGLPVLACVVLGNAAFVMIAMTAAIRPFIKGAGRPTPIHHPESPGLVAGPLILAGCGLAFGLFPQGAERLAMPAVAALTGGSPVVHLQLWHGLTPALGLSLVVVLLGAAMYALWPRAVTRLSGNRRLAAALGDAGYDRLFDGVLALAAATTRLFQNGDQHRYGALVIAATLGMAAMAIFTVSPPLGIDASLQGLRFAPTFVLALMVAGGIAACLLRSLIACIVSMGMIGFGSALIFLLNGAPDLALTQFCVEVLVVVILVALLLQIPVRRSRPRARRGLDLGLASGFGVLTFVALAGMGNQPLDLGLSEFYGANSYARAFGRNVVNVILVDFRALDTMGEIAVIAFAAIGVWGLLGRRAADGGR